MDDTISKTDQVLVLLNRLAVAGENADAAHQKPRQQHPIALDGVKASNELQQRQQQQQQHSNIELPFGNRAPGHRRGSQRASVTGQHEPGAALQIVLGDAQDPAQHVMR